MVAGSPATGPGALAREVSAIVSSNHAFNAIVSVPKHERPLGKSNLPQLEKVQCVFVLFAPLPVEGYSKIQMEQFTSAGEEKARLV